MLIAFYKHAYLPHQPVFSGRLLNPTFSLPQMILYLLAYAISCPVQEFFARGIIQKALFNIYPKYKGAYSIFMASMLFALLHIYISPKMVALALILGLYWGTLYHYFRNLLAITLSHLLIGIWTLYLVGFDQFIYP
jgi:membrane protease YdiL (CAAX protease family)